MAIVRVGKRRRTGARGEGSRLPLLLFGSGGHARVLLDAIREAGEHEVAAILDDDPARAGSDLDGVPVSGGRQHAGRWFARGVRRAIVAVGANRVRRDVARWLASLGFEFGRAVHPRAVVARSARLGAGVAVMAGAVINPGAEVCDHAVVNTGATVDHDVRVGPFAHVAPGAHVAGGVQIGEGAWVGIGAAVREYLSIGKQRA